MKMKQQCRLCLSVAVKVACELDERSKLVDDLCSLHIRLVIHESLPAFVCVTCMKTIENMLKFRETVLLNQTKLLDLLNNTTELKHNEYLKLEDPLADTAIDTYYADIDDKEISETESVSCFEESEACDVDLPVSIKRKSQRQQHKKNVTSKNKFMKLKEVRIHLEKICTNLSEKNDSDNDEDTKKDNEEIKIDVKPKYRHTFESKLKYTKCLTCFTTLPTRKELTKHYRTAHTNKNSKLLNQAQIHLNNQKNINAEGEHVADQPRNIYVCKICGRTFPSVWHIVCHGRAHSESNLFCSLGCGYRTVYPPALTHHERLHNKKQKYQCSTCGAGFHAKTWYQQHQNIHNNIKPYECDVCGKTFHMDRLLKSHRMTVHSDVVKGRKRFICTYCDKTFENIKQHKQHLETHEGKQVFLCDYCGKGFSEKRVLKGHISSHMGLKPYTCGICKKSFTRSNSLKVHQRSHTGHKFPCPSCGTHCTQRSNLRRHMKQFHPGKELPPLTNKSAATVEVQMKGINC